MTRAHPVLLLVFGATLATVGYFLIGFSCPYTFVSTIMTGRIKLPGIWIWLPYKSVLALAMYLFLYAFYAWTRRMRGQHNSAKPLVDPLLFLSLSVGVTMIGFLLVDYPCPNVIDLWLLLRLPIQLDVIGLPSSIPYGWVLTLAACLLLYAAYARIVQRKVSAT